MKASDLKPGQFFEFANNARRLCVWQSSRFTHYVSRDRSDHVMQISNDTEVTPLDVQGWEDEAVESVTPPKLQLREGGWYKRRDGEIVGPCKLNTSLSAAAEWRWRIETETYMDDGKNWYDGDPDNLDLIAEVTPPTQAVTTSNFGNGYSIKFDDLRDRAKFTALGPHGRLGDVETRQEAEELILNEIAKSEPKLQLREGGWYRTQDQRTIGPAKFKPQNRYDNYPWCLNGAWYNDRGQYCAGCSGVDLITEVPPPSPIEQFAAEMREITGPIEIESEPEQFTPNPTHWTIIDGVEVRP